MAIDLGKLRAAMTGGANATPLELARYADDPVNFAVDVLRMAPWSHQRRALEAIAAHRRVSWRSCHGIGKTDTAAAAALWHACTQPESLTIITAPSARQVRSVVWRAIKRLYRNAAVPIGGELHELPEHGLQFPDGRLLIGLSAGDAERFAGLHAPRVLLLVDEASGIEQAIIEAAKGALTGSGRMLLIGNPTRLSGEFFDSHGSKSKLWHTLHTSAFDSPNLTGAEPPIPGLIDQSWIGDMAEDYGEESAVYSVRVKGEFPTQAADAVISLALVDAAKEAWLETMAGGGRVFGTLGPLEIGVDVARFGDDCTCIVSRRGRVALEPVIIRGADVVKVAEHVQRVAADHATAGERATVRVDTVGVGGGVADVLRRAGNLDVRDINAGESSSTANHLRVRDSLWFGLRDWLRAGGCLPPDPKLEAELLAPVYTFTPAGKLVVEAKDETRKRLRRSPDRADALALAVFESVGGRVASFAGSDGKVQPFKPRRSQFVGSMFDERGSRSRVTSMPSDVPSDSPWRTGGGGWGNGSGGGGRTF